MNEAIRKATEELEALACELEHQVTAWNKDLPGVAARLRALAAHWQPLTNRKARHAFCQELPLPVGSKTGMWCCRNRQDPRPVVQG